MIYTHLCSIVLQSHQRVKVTDNSERCRSMETQLPDRQPDNSQVRRRVRKWSILLRVVVLIVAFTVFVVDIVILNIHSVITISWFHNLLIVLAVLGIIFSIVQLFYLWSFFISYNKSELSPTVLPSSSIILQIPSAESPLSLSSVVKTVHRGIV